MGSPDPRAYSRNKRGIAGNLIWINFDRHALLNLFHKARGRYVADVDEIRPQFSLDAPDANALFASSIVRGAGLSIGDTIDKLDTQVSDIYGLNELAEPAYSAQVLPFDITLAGANEYGAMCACKILGVEILNEGSGISVDDAVSEGAGAFAARAFEPVQTRGKDMTSIFATFGIRYCGFGLIGCK